MEKEARPHLRAEWPTLAAIAHKNWSDPAGLQPILSELKYRSRRGARELRKRVTERLVELSFDYFAWPTTEAPESSIPIEQDQFQYATGLLAYLGYRVGQNGAVTSERQHILDYVYNQEVPNVNSPEYMSEWGQPQTGTRLEKTAETIAASVRNAKRRTDADLSLAIQEWEDDLEYTKRRYYDGQYDFEWPTTTP